MKTPSLPLLLFLQCLFITRITAQSECPQCPNYDQFMKQGRSLLEKKDYSKALTEFQAAQVAARACKCTTNAPAEYINKVFSGLKQQKEAAIAAQQRAEKAEQTAKQERNRTQQALKETEQAKADTQAALTKLKKTASQAVTILLAEIDRNILRLEYDSTFAKCQTAIDLEQQRPEVEKRIWEIAYFYTEADTAVAALPFLNLLQPTGFTESTPELNAKLRDYLKKKIPSTVYTFLNERYYPQLLPVEGGSFLREDSVRVTVNNFQMGKTEVTFWQYNVFAKAKQHHIEPPSWQFAGDNPAVNVSWEDAAFYLNWLSRQNGLLRVYTLSSSNDHNYLDVVIDPLANGYRLPTDVEWEFAARGGNLSKRYEYSGDSTLAGVAWYYFNSKNRTHSVGLKKANELGLKDMSGNVEEWCQDWYYEYNYFTKMGNPVEPNSTGFRVLRGGSWANDRNAGCDVSYSFGVRPDFREDFCGFRVSRH